MDRYPALPLLILPAILILMLAGGCATVSVKAVTTVKEKPVGITGAFEHRDRRYITFTVEPEFPVSGRQQEDNLRYAILCSNGRIKTHHSVLPEHMTNSPVPLVRLADRTPLEQALCAAQTAGDPDTIYWWDEDGCISHVLFFTPPTWSHNTISWDTYIPARRYPLLALYPFAVVADVILIPVYIPLAFMLHDLTDVH